MSSVRSVDTVVRATIATEVPKVVKESRKDEEGVSVNIYKPKTPYIGRALLNTKIVGDDAPGETWHMVFTTEGNLQAFWVRGGCEFAYLALMNYPHLMFL